MGRAARSLGHEIVGAMDSAEPARLRLAAEFSCPVFSEVGGCLDAVSSDVALVAGRHIDMPAHVLSCVDRCVPNHDELPLHLHAGRHKSGGTGCNARRSDSADV